MPGEAGCIDLDKLNSAVKDKQLVVVRRGPGAVVDKFLYDNSRLNVLVSPLARLFVKTLVEPRPARCNEGRAVEGRFISDQMNPSGAVSWLHNEPIGKLVKGDGFGADREAIPLRQYLRAKPGFDVATHSG